MKQFKVLAEIDGKIEEFVIFATGWVYDQDKGLCLFKKVYENKPTEIVALFNRNVKAVIEITEELSEDTLKKCIDDKQERR